MATKKAAKVTKKAAKAKPSTKKAAPKTKPQMRNMVPPRDEAAESAVVPMSIWDFEDDSLRDEVLSVGYEYREIQEQLSALEAKKEALKKQLKQLNEAHPDMMGHVVADDWEIVRSKGSNTSISKEALLSLGVSLATIVKATSRKEYTYFQVVEKKKEQCSEGGDESEE